MSQSKSPGPNRLFKSIYSAVIKPDSVGEFIFDGLLAAVLFIIIPIIFAIKLLEIIF